MKTVVYYTFGDMLPTNVGNKKAMFEYFRYLSSRKDIKLILVIIGDVSARNQEVYMEMGVELRLIPRHARWSIYEILNKIVSRVGLDMLRTYFSGVGYRRKFQEASTGADIILITYACWFELLPPRLLRNRTIVLTHDIMFYRRASLYGVDTWWRRLNLKINIALEIRVLKMFRKVAVLAEYEQNILEQHGVSGEDILQIGMPLSPPSAQVSEIPFSDRQYDFLLVASRGYENEQTVRCFIERVAPFLPRQRLLTFALVGGISETADTSGSPDCLKFIRLGFVDDLEPIFANARIGVGTVLHGSGIKVKVVEMAMHYLPMIVTSKGSEGIPFSGEGFLNIDIANDDDVMARLRNWINHPEIAQRQGLETGERIVTAFSPTRVLHGLMDEILK